MSLNIKNEETYRLARELAAVTGENMTVAVTRAVQERLDRTRHDRAGMAERLLAIGRDCSQHLPQSVRAIDHGSLLYNGQGLPR